jgi:hypothetical protein
MLRLSLVASLPVVVLLAVVGCGGAQLSAPAAGSAAQGEGGSHQGGAPPSAGEAVALPKASPGQAAPLAVAPTDADLGFEVEDDDARLQSSSCEELDAEVAASLALQLKEARAALDEDFRRWQAEQPDCWRQYSGVADYWEAVRNGRAHPNLWGDELGDSYGVGGLGLSGIGEGGGGRGEGLVFGAVSSSMVRSGSTSTSGGTHKTSRTNTQVEGVDEADLVKTDGDYLYLAANGALRIVASQSPRVVSVSPLPGEARSLYVQGDRVVVFAAKGKPSQEACHYAYDCDVSGDGTETTVLVYDVHDRAHPKVVRRLELSGSLTASRRVGNLVHLAVVSAGEDDPAELQTELPWSMPRCGIREATVRSIVARQHAANEAELKRASRLRVPTLTEKGKTQRLCDRFYKTRLDARQGFLSLVSFDLTKDNLPAFGSTIQSKAGAVYATEQNLYVAVTHRRDYRHSDWYQRYSTLVEVTELHRFELGAVPQATTYLGSGLVAGHLLNQFAMDEWGGHLRVASSIGRVPDPAVTSEVSIMAPTPSGNLVRIGAIRGLAPGEDVRSVRFEQERGYVVTFKKTDPLFVLDLAEARAPRVLGELKIPGFSTYMHRIDATHLLSIGFDADDQGGFAYFNGVILQLFDVSNPVEPKLLAKEKLGTRGSSSEAATDHLAFNYFAERGLLAVPITLCEGGGNGNYGDRLTFSGLMVYQVSPTEGFRKLGGVDHGTAGQSCQTWWSQSTSQVKRSVFIDEQVFSVALDRIKVQQLAKLGQDVADVSLKRR